MADGGGRVRLGAAGERAARGYLERKGYAILDTNFRCRYGEVDIVAQRRRLPGVPGGAHAPGPQLWVAGGVDNGKEGAAAHRHRGDLQNVQGGAAGAVAHRPGGGGRGLARRHHPHRGGGERGPQRAVGRPNPLNCFLGILRIAYTCQP